MPIRLLLRRAHGLYTANFEARPILTLAVTNAAMATLSDALAQELVLGQRKNPEESTSPATAISAEPPSFDPARTGRFTVYGFCIAPVVHRWFTFLDHKFPLPDALNTTGKKSVAIIGGTIGAVLRRTCVDQIVFAPVGLALFFSAMGVMEGNGKEAIKEKFREAYLPALKANYTLWPLAQFINFALLPLHYRVPFVAAVGVLWTGYLSLLNSETVEELAATEKRDSRGAGVAILHNS